MHSTDFSGENKPLKKKKKKKKRGKFSSFERKIQTNCLLFLAYTCIYIYIYIYIVNIIEETRRRTLEIGWIWERERILDRIFFQNSWSKKEWTVKRDLNVKTPWRNEIETLFQMHENFASLLSDSLPNYATISGNLNDRRETLYDLLSMLTNLATSFFFITFVRI